MQFCWIVQFCFRSCFSVDILYIDTRLRSPSTYSRGVGGAGSSRVRIGKLIL